MCMGKFVTDNFINYVPGLYGSTYKNRIKWNENFADAFSKIEEESEGKWERKRKGKGFNE